MILRTKDGKIIFNPTPKQIEFFNIPLDIPIVFWQGR